MLVRNGRTRVKLQALLNVPLISQLKRFELHFFDGEVDYDPSARVPRAGGVAWNTDSVCFGGGREY